MQGRKVMFRCYTAGRMECRFGRSDSSLADRFRLRRHRPGKDGLVEHGKDNLLEQCRMGRPDRLR